MCRAAIVVLRIRNQDAYAAIGKVERIRRHTQAPVRISTNLLHLIAAQSVQPLSTTEVDKIKDHVDLIRETFFNESGIGYQELDSIDQPTLYKEDDVVEIFIRANSGGTRLGKSDLLFSLLTSSWDEADDKMEILLDELNMQGFAFSRDFILKTCLTLLHQGARYEVEKFRKAGVREDIEGK